MKSENMKVTTANGDPVEFTANLVENLDEAKKLYGENGVFEVFMSGLRVKIMNLARSAFRDGKNREEVEKAIANFKPIKARISNKALAAQLLIEHSETIKNDSSLQESVMKAFMANDYKTVVALLEK